MDIYLSFVVLCYNKWNLVRQTINTLIDSLLRTCYLEKGIEIIIINNGSLEKIDFRLWSKAIEQFIDIRYYCTTENLGYPCGINCGIGKCRGKIIFLLNSDLIFTEGWLEPLVEKLEKDKNVGLVAPFLSNASGEQNIGFIEKRIKTVHDFSRQFMMGKRVDIRTNRAIGACMGIKKEVINKVGGNDFWFGIGHYDDDDLCMRIRIAGYKIVIVGNSFVYHYGSASFKSTNIAIKEVIKSNQEKFLNKWQLNSIDEDREKRIKNILYDNNQHYIPIHKIDYNKIGNDRKKIGDILIVADWNNKTSKWREKINNNININYKYTMWIPQKYFKLNMIKELPYDNSKIQINTNSIPHIEIYNFVSFFEKIMEVDNDYINKFIIGVANDLNKNIL